MQGRILDAALAQFPVIGDQLRANVHRLPAKGLALAIGLAGALWAGLGGVKAAQNAMDFVWDVPIKRQPNFIKALGRAVAMLATLGVFLVLASFLGGVASGSEEASLGVRVAGVIASSVLNIAIFLVAFRVLTVEDVGWSDVFPGAVVAGVSWSVLQAAGGYILGQARVGGIDLRILRRRDRAPHMVVPRGADDLARRGDQRRSGPAALAARARLRPD